MSSFWIQRSPSVVILEHIPRLKSSDQPIICWMFRSIHLYKHRCIFKLQFPQILTRTLPPLCQYAVVEWLLCKMHVLFVQIKCCRVCPRVNIAKSNRGYVERVETPSYLGCLKYHPAVHEFVGATQVATRHIQTSEPIDPIYKRETCVVSNK